MRTVDHDGGEASVDAGLADVEIRAVIQMHHHGEVVFHESGFHQLHDVGLSGIFAGSRGNLKDKGRPFLASGLHDALDDFHVVHVERADGVAFPAGALKHGFGCGKGHEYLLISWPG